MVGQDTGVCRVWPIRKEQLTSAIGLSDNEVIDYHVTNGHPARLQVTRAGNCNM